MTTYSAMEECMLSFPLSIGSTAELCDSCAEWARLRLPRAALCDACWEALANPHNGYFDVVQGVDLPDDVADERFDEYIARLEALRAERGPLERTPEHDRLLAELIEHRVDAAILSALGVPGAARRTGPEQT